MGNKATKAFNNIFPVVSRAVKNYNFTDRAERAITKDKRPTKDQFLLSYLLFLSTTRA
jgi:hypothetical protein